MRGKRVKGGGPTTAVGDARGTGATCERMGERDRFDDVLDGKSVGCAVPCASGSKNVHGAKSCELKGSRIDRTECDSTYQLKEVAESSVRDLAPSPGAARCGRGRTGRVDEMSREKAALTKQEKATALCTCATRGILVCQRSVYGRPGLRHTNLQQSS